MLNNYDQILFDDSSADNAGTVYNSDGTTGTGRTIGLFNSETGISSQSSPDGIRLATGLNPALPSWFMVYNARLRISGLDAGSSQRDSVVLINFVDEVACSEINRGLTGSADISSFALSGANDATAGILTNAGAFNTSGTFASIIDVGTDLPGCFLDSGPGIYFYVHPIKIN